MNNFFYKQDYMQVPKVSVDNTNSYMLSRKLPHIWLLQMDNCARDNKNCYVFAFASLLIARRVLEIVEVGFLLVGHTHEDIYITYERLLAQIKKKSIFSLLEMMNTYKTC